MIEKVNPAHPDKVADRIAGAIVDLAYSKEKDPKMAVEVLIGHGKCHIIAETSLVEITIEEVEQIVRRIAGDLQVEFDHVPQDVHLADNQTKALRCGDNGIFLGMPLTREETDLSQIARFIYSKHPVDGKYILASDELIICQSNVTTEALLAELGELPIPSSWERLHDVKVNPIGDWTGGTDVDTGATNRKLGSDMGHSVTGGGLHGKDLSKADVSVNIFAFAIAQLTGKPVQLYCAIGDESICGIPYAAIVEFARHYIKKAGGFEKFAEWGLY